MRWLPRRSGRSGRHSVTPGGPANRVNLSPHTAQDSAQDSALGSAAESAGKSTAVAPFQRRPVDSSPVARPRSLVRPIQSLESGVYLGFADGSVLELAASDPRTNAFRALARTLAQGDP